MRSIGLAATLLLSGALLFTCTSCGNEGDNPEGLLTATPDGNDYAFTYPDNWETLRDDSMVAIGSPDGLANISTACFSIPADILSPREYADGTDEHVGYLTMLGNTYGDACTITSDEDTTLDGRDAVKITYHIRIGDDEYQFVSVLAVLRTGFETSYLYDLTYTASPESFDTHLPVFEQVCSSFSFN